MKTNTVYLFLILLSSFTFCAHQKRELPIKITVHLSEALAQEPQWVYWFSAYGNELDIEDSLFLQKGQTLFVFEKNINKGEEEYNAYLTFSKNGPTQAVMKLVPGDIVAVYIDEQTKPFYPKVEGSLACEEKYRNRMLIDAVKDTVRYLTDSLITITDKQKIAELEERIERYRKYINKDSYFEFFKNAKSPLTAYSMVDVISFKYPNENIDELVKDMKARFPDNKKIQEFPNYEPYPPASQRSKQAHAKFDQLLNMRYPDASNKSTLTIDKKTLEQIKPYQMGNKVDSVSLKGLSGSIITLNDIQTEYILIDFWAAWCAPCRKEIPYLKKVAEKYPKLITIYALSLDSNEAEWRNAIEIDKSELFTHAFSGLITSAPSTMLLARFGVKAVPANFLLDKNRKIIAIDLRGEELMKKMDELVKQ